MAYLNNKMNVLCKHEHYLNNTDEYYVKALIWRKQNPERKKELTMKSYWKNRAKELVRKKTWRDVNKKQMRMMRKIYNIKERLDRIPNMMLIEVV